MRFEWDEAKRRSNLTRHGIDFADLVYVFEGPIVRGGNPIIQEVDDRYDYGEQRFLTFVLLSGRVIAIVHTETNQTIRLISARKASKYEEIKYFKEIWN